MDLARLAALSFGEPTLTYERWLYVKDLELARLSRLPPPPGHVPASPVSVSAV